MSSRAAWLTARSDSPTQALLLLPFLPLAWLYAAGAWLHRAAYRFGARRRSRFPGRVVSVGSLVVGGSAKTPMAAWVAAGLRARGHKVAIATRGYGGKPGDAVLVVSDGRYVRSRAEAAGDEAMVLAARTPGVPVLVGRNRALAAWRALSAFGADVVVLDDDFQHHRLQRDLDLVCFDGHLGLGNRQTLPCGPLREPLGALRFADAFGVVDGPLPPADAALLARVAPGAHRFEARRVPVGVRPLRGGAWESPAVLQGREVGLLAALANPGEFRRTLEALGARVVAERIRADHHRYRRRDLRKLGAAAPLWITTEKDAVKLQPHWADGAEVRVLRIALAVDEPEEFLDWIDARLH